MKTGELPFGIGDTLKIDGHKYDVADVMLMVGTENIRKVDLTPVNDGPINHLEPTNRDSWAAVEWKDVHPEKVE